MTKETQPGLELKLTDVPVLLNNDLSVKINGVEMDKGKISLVIMTNGGKKALMTIGASYAVPTDADKAAILEGQLQDVMLKGTGNLTLTKDGILTDKVQPGTDSPVRTASSKAGINFD